MALKVVGRSWTRGRSLAREAELSVVLSRYSTLENTTMQLREIANTATGAELKFSTDFRMFL